MAVLNPKEAVFWAGCIQWVDFKKLRTVRECSLLELANCPKLIRCANPASFRKTNTTPQDRWFWLVDALEGAKGHEETNTTTGPAEERKHYKGPNTTN